MCQNRADFPLLLQKRHAHTHMHIFVPTNIYQNHHYLIPCREPYTNNQKSCTKKFCGIYNCWAIIHFNNFNANLNLLAKNPKKGKEKKKVAQAIPFTTHECGGSSVGIRAHTTHIHSRTNSYQLKCTQT